MDKYEEAMKLAELMVHDGIITQDCAEKIFPELKESEDERIRKAIIHKLTSSEPLSIDLQTAISWLEKQYEQKPAEWSEEDEIIISVINDIINIVERKTGDWYYTGSEKVFYSDIRNWLKSLRPQNHRKPTE